MRPIKEKVSKCCVSVWLNSAANEYTSFTWFLFFLDLLNLLNYKSQWMNFSLIKIEEDTAYFTVLKETYICIT